jgi:hypothetical protein
VRALPNRTQTNNYRASDPVSKLQVTFADIVVWLKDSALACGADQLCSHPRTIADVPGQIQQFAQQQLCKRRMAGGLNRNNSTSHKRPQGFGCDVLLGDKPAEARDPEKTTVDVLHVQRDALLSRSEAVGHSLSDTAWLRYSDTVLWTLRPAKRKV